MVGKFTGYLRSNPTDMAVRVVPTRSFPGRNAVFPQDPNTIRTWNWPLLHTPLNRSPTLGPRPGCPPISSVISLLFVTPSLCLYLLGKVLLLHRLPLRLQGGTGNGKISSSSRCSEKSDLTVLRLKTSTQADRPHLKDLGSLDKFNRGTVLIAQVPQFCAHVTFRGEVSVLTIATVQALRD
jgi:hypothetical protein